MREMREMRVQTLSLQRKLILTHILRKIHQHKLQTYGLIAEHCYSSLNSKTIQMA